MSELGIATVWTVALLAGTLFAAADLADALVDMRIVASRFGSNSPERMVAFHNLVSQAARLTVLLALAAMGGGVMTNSLSSSGFRLLMYSVATVVVADSVRSRVARKRLLRRIGNGD